MLNLEIITPDRIAYSTEADMVSVPSTLGTLGILPRHIPLFAQLIAGELKVKKGKEEYYLAIGAGFIQVLKNKVIILVTRAVREEELNEKEILRARKEAEEALKRGIKGEEKFNAESALRHSIFDLRIISKKRRLVH